MELGIPGFYLEYLPVQLDGLLQAPAPARLRRLIEQPVSVVARFAP
jgi:hypothetical protein